MPSVDVIIVNYNGGAYLKRCLQSVLASNHLLDVFVVDNASSDDSFTQVQDFDAGKHRLNFIANEDNKGFSKAVNQAATQGDSDYILLLNPDCEVYPHTIGNFIGELAKHPEAGVAGALVFNQDGSEQRGCRRLEPTFARSIVTALRLDKHFSSVNLQHSPLPEQNTEIDAVSGAAMLTRRSTFDKLGGLDEGYFLHVEDLDYCRQVRELGQKVLFVPGVSLFHHQGVSSKKVPYAMEWHKHAGMLRYHQKYQKPHQSWLRSSLSRAVIYLNFGLSVARHAVRFGANEEHAPRSYVAAHQNKIVITGANSDVGHAMLASLVDEAQPVLAVTRRKIPKTIVGNEIWLNWGYFEKVPAADLGAIKQWLAFSPIWSAPVLAQVLSRHRPPERIVAMSSTSIEGKRDTTDGAEQQVVTALQQGEDELLAWGQQSQASVSIGRASMVYGGPNNKNVRLIKKITRLLRFFPLVGEGEAKRQPVHVDDLVQAVNAMRQQDSLPQSVYTLAGGEVLSYKQMVSAIFVANNQQPKFTSLSVSALKKLAGLIAYLPKLGFINGAMVERMQQDLCYDISPAKLDFNYQPGKFRP